jgi:hypothetical protein
MAVTLTAVLLTASNPRPVQITLNGTTAGQSYTITGTTGDGASWTVPGGTGVSAGSQIVVTDNRSALNVPVTYQAVVAGVTYTAAPVTVTWAGVGVLQTLDGQTIVDVEVASVREPRKYSTRGSVFEIAGRADPAARLDVAGSATYTWMLETQSADSTTMEAILSSGLPVVRRLVPGMRDLKTVVIGIVTDWSDELITDGLDTWRRFTITVREISDPQPSAIIAAYVWDDFDTAMLKRVWSYHSTLANVSGLTATNGSLSSQASGGYQDGANTSFGRLTVTTAATAASVFETAFTAAAATLGTAVVPGMVVTVTLRVKGTVGRTVNAAIKWSGGAIASGATVAATGSWQQVSVTATAPAGTTGLAYGVQLAATGVLAGDLVDFDAVTISQGTTVPVGTFDEIFTTWDQFDAADWAQYF